MKEVKFLDGIVENMIDVIILKILVEGLIMEFIEVVDKVCVEYVGLYSFCMEIIDCFKCLKLKMKVK